jgi:hypothetical protein
MNCTEFGQRWAEHVCGVLQPPHEAAMLEHSHACVTCGKQWRDHQDLALAVERVLGTDRLPENLAKSVVDRLPVRRAVLAPTAAVAGGQLVAAPAHLPVVAAALAGAVVGFSLLGIGLLGFGHAAGPEQLLPQGNSEPFFSIRFLSGMQVVALFLRTASDIVWTCLGILLLSAIARTTVWEALFPENIPGGVKVARVFAMVAVVFGVLRILCSIAPVLAWLLGVATGHMPDFMMLAAGEASVAVLWNLAYWTTLTVLAATVLNQLLLRYGRPLQ